MKKILFIVTLICGLMIMSIVLADMGAPEINKYKATPKSVDGAPYYEYKYDPVMNEGRYEEIGILPYGTIIEMYYESIENGIKYGHFLYEDGSFEAKLEDLTVANADENVYTPFSTTRNMKVLANDIPIYSGPAYIYDVIGTIPKETEIVVRRIGHTNEFDGSFYEEEMNPWLYVEYNGISGWVCELNSAIGQYQDKELILLVDLSVSGDEIAIPANTRIQGYYQSDMWTNNALVNYEGKDYLISLYDCAVNASEWYQNGYEIKYDIAKIYRTASKNSEVLVDEIPNGTILPIKYIQYGLRWMGWIGTEYNGVDGWTLYFEEDEALDNYLSGEYNVDDVEKGEATLVQEEEIKTVEENQNDSNTNVLYNGEPFIPSKPIVSNTVIYIGIAVIIALTATVIVLLINRKK